jgi:RNA polymerase sigma-70 factor (ECF subfamily)
MPPVRAATEIEVAEPVVTDAALLEALRESPGRTLPALLARFERPLLRHAAAVLRDASAAQDVVQDAVLRLLAHRGRIDNLAAWLMRVTHNLALDHLRKEKRRQRLHLEASAGPEPLAEPADRALERREAAARVREELARLAPHERAVLSLKVREGRSYKEIAAITRLSESNVGYLLHHAMKKLLARLRAADTGGPTS